MRSRLILVVIVGLLALMLAVQPAVAGTRMNPTLLEADVAVVGGGFAGLVTAITAADRGASVVVFEKTNRTGGTLYYAGGTISGSNALMQYEKGILDDSAEAFYVDLFKAGGGNHIPDLAWHHVRRSGSAVDFMDSIGVDFGDREPIPLGYLTFESKRRQYVAADGGRGFLHPLNEELDKRIEKGTVTLLLDTRVTQLLQSASGEVIGGIAEGTDGPIVFLSGSAVLATGGYAASIDLLERFNFDNVLSVAPTYATGDGHTMAEEAGAGYSQMEFLHGTPGGIPIPDHPGRAVVVAATTGYPGLVWVDLDGQRMADEYGSNPMQARDVWQNAPENTVFLVFDESVKAANEPILSTYSIPRIRDRDWDRFEEEAERGVWIRKADTVGELADLWGIARDGFEETIANYNEYVRDGHDPEFGRTELGFALENPPYYAIKTYPFVLSTRGGPAMNDRAELLDSDGQVIPGLYQAGEIIGFANIAGHTTVGGLHHAVCVVWGQTAGESAADYALRNR